MERSIIYTLKEYKQQYNELLNSYLLEFIDFDELDFVQNEISSYKWYLANTMIYNQNDEKYFDEENNVFIVGKIAYPVINEIAEKANEYKGSYDFEGYDLFAFSFKKILKFLKDRKLELDPEPIKTDLIKMDAMEYFIKKETPTDFFIRVVEDKTTDLEKKEFISNTIDIDLLKSDWSKFYHKYIVEKVVDGWFNQNNNSKVDEDEVKVFEAMLDEIEEKKPLSIDLKPMPLKYGTKFSVRQAALHIIFNNLELDSNNVTLKDYGVNNNHKNRGTARDFIDELKTKENRIKLFKSFKSKGSFTNNINDYQKIREFISEENQIQHGFVDELVFLGRKGDEFY